MKNDATDEDDEHDGLREKKRKETLHRIAETGLSLFLANGYEATTLDAIAKAAGVSRRTIFHYFESKEEILLAYQSGIGEMIRAAVLQEPTDQTPLDAVLNALVKLNARFNSEQMIAIDRLLRSTEQLRARKHAKYMQQEQTLFEALCQMWPQPERRKSLRVVAMMSIGALRLAIDAWADEGGKQSPQKYLREAFANLKTEL